MRQFVTKTIAESAYRALDTAEWKSDCCVPILRRLFDQIVDSIANLGVGSGVGICVHGRNRAGQLPVRFQKTVDSG